MLEKGLQFIKEVVVKPENLAVAMGSGDLPVLATPAMVAFMENAALSAVEDQLPERQYNGRSNDSDYTS